MPWSSRTIKPNRSQRMELKAGAQTLAEYGPVMEKGISFYKVWFSAVIHSVTFYCPNGRFLDFLVYPPDRSVTYVIAELFAVCRTCRQDDSVSLFTAQAHGLLPPVVFAGNQRPKGRLFSLLLQKLLSTYKVLLLHSTYTRLETAVRRGISSIFPLTS